MRTHAEGVYNIHNWDEKTWDGKAWNEVEGIKQTHAIVTETFHGAIEGEASSHSLMAYNADGTASYVGLTTINGTVAGRSGSFVLQHTGKFANGVAKATSFVVPGSGTGELAGLRGESSYETGHGMEVPYTFDYEFA
jgi:hypothetical protein